MSFWDSVVDGSLGDNSQAAPSYTPNQTKPGELEDPIKSPKTLLHSILTGKLNQKPTDEIIPESGAVCSLLYDICYYAKWHPGHPTLIPCKKRSSKKFDELQSLILEKCGIRVKREHLPTTGYQIEYFLELFKYIRGIHETSKP